MDRRAALKDFLESLEKYLKKAQSPYAKQLYKKKIEQVKRRLYGNS